MVDYLEVALLYIYFVNFMTLSIDEIKKIGRRWWVHEYNYEQRRNLLGAFNMTFMYFKHNDSEKFYNFVRMTPPQFEYIYNIVRPHIEKHSWRTPLDPQLRLAVTLQYVIISKSQLQIKAYIL